MSSPSKIFIPIDLIKSTCEVELNKLTGIVTLSVTAMGRTSSMKLKDGAGSNATFYARLDGPAYVTPHMETANDNLYTFSFSPPLKGNYDVELALLYDGFSDEECNRHGTAEIGSNMQSCFFSCHDGNVWCPRTCRMPSPTRFHHHRLLPADRPILASKSALQAERSPADAFESSVLGGKS